MARAGACAPRPTPRPRRGITATMMKTLFLQPPSFDGFDGGAGSRYQAKREIQSFWYPTWLAQPAALVPGSKLIDAPPARHRHGAGARRGASEHDLVRHPHLDALLRLRREGRAGAEGREPGAQDRLRRRQGRGAAGGEPASRAPPIDFVARNEFDFTIKDVAEGRDFADDRRHLLPQRRRARSSTTRTARSSRTWTSCPS